MLETFFLNLFHGSRCATMAPKLVNEDGDLFLDRPPALVSEADGEAFSRAMEFSIIPCDLCGSQEALRVQVKTILDEWEASSPRQRGIMARALKHVRTPHLTDPALFNSLGLALGGANGEKFKENQQHRRQAD